MKYITSLVQENRWNHQQNLTTRYILAHESAHNTTTTSKDSIIARISTIESNGTYDLDQGVLCRSRQGVVAEALMTC